MKKGTVASIVGGGLLGGALLIATGMRTHSRLRSKPSREIEQRLAQNAIYQDIVAQTSCSPLMREITGVYIDTLLPYFLHRGSKISTEQREYLRTNRYDSITGKHKPYSPDERALLWHLGTNPEHPNMGKDHVLNTLEVSAFQKP